jgi:hypothetical protein
VADQPANNETLRQMMAGFNAMQYSLGLMPMQQAQAMAGAPAPFQAPPPPPQIPHPSEAAAAAMQNQQAMMQHSLHIAQATRYSPPPSAPMPSLSAMSAYAPMVPPAGGGGFAGGGMRGGIAGYGGGFAPAAMAMPSIFNPLAPTLPGAHFMSPSMRHLQVQQHAQSQFMGMAAGVGEGAMGLGGSIIGGALGSAFGPLGTIAGSWLGGKVGGAVSGAIFNPVTADFARGRQTQQMTSPFMVSGSNLNMATGQGLSAQAGRDVATGIRHLSRDYDFERTGFNTQDAMRIMQSSASQGLLTGSQSPDQIVQKVKDISKTVKMLMRITGDPDVQDAIRSLGEMRNLGFQGLAAQAGAVANRAVFARMAGQSQAQMTATMMAGADMAGQFGLVGATGASAAMYGAGAANVAASSGAVGEIALARAGGVGGLGRINAMGSLAAMQNEQYLLAAMGRDAKGHMTVDMERYRANQGRPFEEVQRMAADALRRMDTKGIFEWNTQRQELKDRVAQQLRPGEGQQMMLAQARQLQAAVPTMNLGTAIQQTTGLSASDAGVLEHQLTSRRYWEGMAQQNRVQRAEVAEQERAYREEYRTPGLMTRMGRGIRGGLGAASDFVSSPFRSLSEYGERVSEARAAADAGERISRYDESDIAHDEGERELLRASLARGGGPRGGASAIDVGTAGRNLLRVTSLMGLSTEGSANRLAALADFSRGRFTSLGESFGDAQSALARVQDVAAAGRAMSGGPLKAAESGTLYQRIADVGGAGRQNASSVIGAAKTELLSTMKGMTAGLIKSSGALAESDFKSAFVRAASRTMSAPDAEKAWAANKDSLMREMVQTAYDSGDKKLIEVAEKSKEVQARAGGVDLSTSTRAAEEQISDELKRSGVGSVSDKSMSEIKSIVAHHDNATIELATIERARTSGNLEEKAQAQTLAAQLEHKLGFQKIGELQHDAHVLAQSMSDDTADAFERTLRGTADSDELNKKLETVRDAAGDKMKFAAQQEFKQKLDQYHKGAAGAGSVEEAVGMISEDELDKLPDSLRDAVTKFRKTGDWSGLNKEIEKASPTARTSRHSDAASSALDQLDKDYDRLQDEADRAEDQGEADRAEDQGDGGEADKSTTLFADSVKVFADAVKTLSGKSDEAALHAANPTVQSVLHDFYASKGMG